MIAIITVTFQGMTGMLEATLSRCQQQISACSIHKSGSIVLRSVEEDDEIVFNGMYCTDGLIITVHVPPLTEATHTYKGAAFSDVFKVPAALV